MMCQWLWPAFNQHGSSNSSRLTNYYLTISAFDESLRYEALFYSCNSLRRPDLLPCVVHLPLNELSLIISTMYSVDAILWITVCSMLGHQCANLARHFVLRVYRIHLNIEFKKPLGMSSYNYWAYPNEIFKLTSGKIKVLTLQTLWLQGDIRLF